VRSVEVRRLPVLDDLNRDFWTRGEDGQLRFQRCQDCGYYVHPPGPVCPVCLSKNLAFDPVSGRATVLTYTINYQPWQPGQDVPYVVAIVGLKEQEGLNLTTNIVNCEPDDVTFGMPVVVTFKQVEDVWLPLFEPAHRGS
jgi:uncharacterized OB-fold protein